jgi:hypothetical protein
LGEERKEVHTHIVKDSVNKENNHFEVKDWELSGMLSIILKE